MIGKTHKIVSMHTVALNRESHAWIRTIDEGKGYTAIHAPLFRTLLSHIKGYAFYRTLLRYIRPGHTVLEAGCGWAISSFALAAEGGVSVTALDISEKLITDLRYLQTELGGTYAAHLTLMTGDIFHLREIRRTFDVVYSDGTYEHFLDEEDRRKILEEVRSVLPVKGIFIVAVPNLRNPFFGSVVDAKMPAMYTFTITSLAAELERGGLRVLETGFSFVNPGFEQWVRSRWMVAGIRTVSTFFHYLPRSTQGFLAAHLYCVAQKA